MRPTVIRTVLLGLLPASLWAQDPNVSLIFAMPQLANPAFAGLIEGDWRFSASHRWRAATESEDYQTSLFQGDYRINTRSMRGGMGLLMSTDRTPGLRTSQAQFSFAYEAPLGVKVRYDHLRVGFSAGIIHRALVEDELVYEDQFQNPGGFILPTGEDYPRLGNLVPDVSMGLMWYRTQKIRGNPEFNHYLGFGVHHLNRPQLGFYFDDRERANIKYSALAGAKIRTRTPLDFNLAFLWSIQNNSNQVTANAFARYTFFENGIPFGRHRASVMLGLVYRNSDAVVTYAGFELKESISFGLAFDIYANSNTRFTANSFGGLQTMFSYLIGHRRWREPTLPFPFF